MATLVECPKCGGDGLVLETDAELRVRIERHYERVSNGLRDDPTSANRIHVGCDLCHAKREVMAEDAAAWSLQHLEVVGG